MSGPTQAQRAVLDWMVAYPDLEIGWEVGEYARWSAYWRNEEARLHMLGVIADLGPILGPIDARADPRSYPRGGTPRLTSQTMVALVRRGWVRMVRHRRADGVWASQSYWQISQAGAQAVSPGLAVVHGGLSVSLA